MAESKPDISSSPRHRQVFGHYAHRIRQGELAPGTRLPPETAIAASFGMSRGTVRQAMRALEQAGLIDRTPGRGTFVRGTFKGVAAPADPVPVRDRHMGVRCMGVVLPYGDLQEGFFTDILEGVRAACRSRDAQLSPGYSHENAGQERAELGRLVRAGCAGLIVFAQLPDVAVPVLEASRLPFVLIDRRPEVYHADFVGVDNAGGAYRATEHLILLGHRRIAFVHYNAGSDTFAVSAARERWAGYRKALADHGLPFVESWSYSGAPSRAGEDEASAYLPFFSQPDRPTAAFVVNDRTAILLVRAAKLAGAALPGDLALVSFDDLPIVSQLSVALSSVRQPRFDLGFRAAHRLLDRLEGKVSEPLHLILPTELKIRESCGARPVRTPT